MKLRIQTMKLGLGALALGLCADAQAGAPCISNLTWSGTAPRLTILSDTSVTNLIQYSTNLSQTNWVTVTNSSYFVQQSPYTYVHVGAPAASSRFYRVMVLPQGATAPTNMVLIPAGSFTMGDLLDGDTNALPLHTNYVSAFSMDKYPVTKALWDDVYNWATNHGYSFDNAGSGKATNHPVQTVNWYDCVKWCNARSQKENKTPAYYTEAGQANVYRVGQINVDNAWVNWASGYRLPTEAEWETAARGGVSGQRYPWGNTISWSQATYYAYPLSAGGYAYDANSTEGYSPALKTGGYPYTSPVGSFAANGYGLYDMAQNVVEWCWDWKDTYQSGSQTDFRGPSSGSVRVFRGGGWYSIANSCRVAFRDGGRPDGWNDDVGFRSVLPPVQP